jgi:hypothetical protein
VLPAAPLRVEPPTRSELVISIDASAEDAEVGEDWEGRDGVMVWLLETEHYQNFLTVTRNA